MHVALKSMLCKISCTYKPQWGAAGRQCEIGRQGGEGETGAGSGVKTQHCLLSLLGHRPL